MTTTARTYADRLNTLELHRQDAYRYVNMGRLYNAANKMRRKCASETDAITKNLDVVDRLTTTNVPGLNEDDRAVALGIAAQCAITAIRTLTRNEIRVMALTDLAALLNDPDAHPIEREIGIDNLHDRYMAKIGDDAYNKLLDAWIKNGTPDGEVRGLILTELGAA